MVAKRIRFLLFIVCLFASMLTMACGTKYNVRGQVVDASTNAPIEGASIAIDWTGQNPEAYLAPYASGHYLLEKVKTESDKTGYFTIPKYPLATEFLMGVYKKGYVCWYSRAVFLKGQKDIHSKKIVDKRKGFKIRHGMTIKLEPFTDEYYKPTHARFVEHVSYHCGGLEGITDEMKIYRKYYRK